jgi:hypothetical protein
MTGADGCSIRYREASYQELLTFIRKYGRYEETREQNAIKGGKR